MVIPETASFRRGQLAKTSFDEKESNHMGPFRQRKSVSHGQRGDAWGRELELNEQWGRGR